MRNKASICGGLLLALLLVLSGCGTENNGPGAPVSTPVPPAKPGPPTPAATAEPAGNGNDTAYLKIYSVILDRYAWLIASGTPDYDTEGMTAVSELISGNPDGKAPDHVGFALLDLSGDNTPELLIATISVKEDAASYGNNVFAVYTIADGAPVFSFEGWGRNSYRMLTDNLFLYRGSDGAMRSLFGVYTLAQDGMSLLCKEFYFTDEKEGKPEEIGFYHNKTGQLDRSFSDELTVAEGEFWQIETALENQMQDIELTPFSAYAPTGPAPVSAARLDVQWADKALSAYSEYEEFIADTSDAQVGILLITDQSVKNFKVLSLVAVDADEQGNPTFETKELYTLESLTPERPLLLKMTFYGDLPSYGVSYSDENGETRSFSINLSGKDGSLYLSAF